MPTEASRILEAYPLLTQLPAHLLIRIRSELQPVRAFDSQELFNVGDSCTALPRKSVRKVPVSSKGALPPERTSAGLTLRPAEVGA